MADLDMDIDMDVDIGFDAETDPEIARLRAEVDQINALPSSMDVEAINGEAEEGELEATSVLLNKVHIRGVDNLTTKDLENFANDHYPSDLFKKVEWIDDATANLVYDTEEAGSEALSALSAQHVEDVLELRPAKGLATHSHVELQVRHAVVSDVKLPGAAKRSRFYLMNPEHDPESRPKRRKVNETRKSQGRRDRRDSINGESFDVNLYDDDAESIAKRAPIRPASHDEDLMTDRPFRKRPARDDEDIFSGREHGRLRNRSASPARDLIRDGDGRYGFSDDQPARKTARRRSPTVTRKTNHDNYNVRDGLRMELFPDRRNESSLVNGGHENAHQAPDLFANRNQPTPSKSGSKELFPDKVHHRRQDAKDLHPDEIADAIGKCHIYSHIHTDSRNDSNNHDPSGRRPEHARDAAGSKPRDLFSRIDGGPGKRLAQQAGRLNDQRPMSAGDADLVRGFSIKGAGVENSGFSILGASRVDEAKVKELFPRNNMAAGTGQSGFDGRIKGRGAQRRRGEDLF